MIRVQKLAFIAALLLVGMILLATRIFAPLTPHGISGFIFQSDWTTQVPVGTAYGINDTVSGNYIRGITTIDVPDLSGAYFETISGSDGDLTLLFAWNATHYGNTSVALLGDMENVNITINTSRAVETNITILSPQANGTYNVTEYFNITANISVLGAAGAGCNATIRFGDTSVLNVSSLDSANHSLGSIALGSHYITSWNISAQSARNSTVIAAAACEQQGTVLEKVDLAIIYNVTVIDNGSPQVTLIAPANNTVTGVNNVTFTYNVTDNSNIMNCSLLINNQVNASNATTVQKGATQNITQNLNNARYNWTIRCIDKAGNPGNGTNFNLTVNQTNPVVSNMLVTSPVRLLAASTLTAWCNATVSKPGDTAINISRVNATFYDDTIRTFDSPDDNNDHYTNSSCANLTLMADSTDYSCAFPVRYYANNASWTCNITATDNVTQTGSRTATTVINELIAITSGGVIDYYRLYPGNISNESNLTLANAGNKNLNITVRGYGGPLASGDNLSMVCSTGNISVTSHRYAVNYSTSYTEMANLTNQSTMVTNFTLYQKTNDAANGTEFNQTYWRIQADYGTGGNCSGTVAVAATLA